MDTAIWEAAGLYDPESPLAGERRELLEFLVARGATLEQMTDANALGGLPGLAGDLVRGSARWTLTVEEVAARTGIPAERVERVLLAAGLPVAADDRLPEDLVAIMPAFEQGSRLMGDDAILAFTRVLGAAATNIAEAAIALFYAEFGPGTEREGATELDRARLSESASLALGAVPDVLSHLLMAQTDRASRRALMARGWWSATDDVVLEGEVVALGFVDLVGSTHWAEGLSLREHSLALAHFESVAWSSAVQRGGRVVKMIGDEVFFAAPTVVVACRIGGEICRTVGSDPLLPEARGAVGVGMVAPREGDYFGPLVNLVSRLVKAAEPGALVATAEAVAELPPEDWDVDDLGEEGLRGLEHPVRVFEVKERRDAT